MNNGIRDNLQTLKSRVANLDTHIKTLAAYVTDDERFMQTSPDMRSAIREELDATENIRVALQHQISILSASAA